MKISPVYKAALSLLAVIALLPVATAFIKPAQNAPAASQVSAATSPEPTHEQAIAEYKAALEAIPGIDAFISDVRPGLLDGIAEIEVTTAYRSESKPAKEDLSTALWEAWAAVYGAEDVDKARIRLVDAQGKEVGGSKAIAGSVIYVDD